MSSFLTPPANTQCAFTSWEDVNYDKNMTTKLQPIENDIVVSNKVLVVEDSETQYIVIDGVLKANGYLTKHAENGQEALRLVREWSPSVILLDIIMPGMEGGEVCNKIRAMQLPVRPAIIIVSSKTDKKTVVQTLNIGADDFLSKPFNDAELIARVKAQQRLLAFHHEIEEDKKNVERILDVTTAISASLDTNEVLNIVVNKVAEATNAVRCSIVLVAKENEGYVLASHEDASVTELKIDLSKYPEIKKVIASKTPLSLSNMSENPLLAPVKENLSSLTDMSALVVPIVFNDEVLGTLFLRARRKDRGFTKKEIDFCQIVANTSYYAIKNARLFDKILREKDSLKEIAAKDQLTMLYNHNFFYSRLDEEFDRAVRYDTSLALIMLDIDNFKAINDTFGHQTGDVVLKEISAMIKRGVRKTDMVARYGGEEFAVILPHTPIEGASEEAERLRELIASHCYAGLTKEKITVSVGVAAYPHLKTMTSDELVSYADSALYKAKWAGKDCVKIAVEGETLAKHGTKRASK